MDEPSDADLVVLARSDDTEAFRLLIERYQAMAYSIALHLVSQPETAQDLVLTDLPLSSPFSAHNSSSDGSTQ
jgi:hypothetical protein